MCLCLAFTTRFSRCCTAQQMAEGEWTEWRRRSVVSCEWRGGREGTVGIMVKCQPRVGRLSFTTPSTDFLSQRQAQTFFHNAKHKHKLLLWLCSGCAVPFLAAACPPPPPQRVWATQTQQKREACTAAPRLPLPCCCHGSSCCCLHSFHLLTQSGHAAWRSQRAFHAAAQPSKWQKGNGQSGGGEVL